MHLPICQQFDLFISKITKLKLWKSTGLKVSFTALCLHIFNHLFQKHHIIKNWNAFSWATIRLFVMPEFLISVLILVEKQEMMKFATWLLLRNWNATTHLKCQKRVLLKLIIQIFHHSDHSAPKSKSPPTQIIDLTLTDS